MSTPLTDSINALTAYANETTGKQDTTLSDAVGSLVEGYGGGGAGVASGTYIPTEDATAYSIDTGITGFTRFLLVPHELPYASGVVTQKPFCSEYVDFGQGYCINTHGGASSSTSPTQVFFCATSHSYAPKINGTKVERGGSTGYNGQMFAGVQYDWYAW